MIPSLFLTPTLFWDARNLVRGKLLITFTVNILVQNAGLNHLDQERLRAFLLKFVVGFLVMTIKNELLLK